MWSGSVASCRGSWSATATYTAQNCKPCQTILSMLMQVEAATGGQDVVRFCGGLHIVLRAAGLPLQKALPTSAVSKAVPNASLQTTQLEPQAAATGAASTAAPSSLPEPDGGCNHESTAQDCRLPDQAQCAAQGVNGQLAGHSQTDQVRHCLGSFTCVDQKLHCCSAAPSKLHLGHNNR